ncbi:MAG TPA: transketolase C-terminal domain-containing protein [Candidatus Baltobacteraceae bacterium]|nr:transketolase C-terminal domain-containing protein [Candidatus Baltobacteraceae bacterium]
MRQSALNAVYDLAKRDPRVLFIGSDLGAGVLEKFKAEMPDRYFMEGVSEAAIIGMSAGLAMDGFIPYFNTIATFITRRGFEQVAVDLCLHDLPVRLLASGGGAVYAPLGPTHMALEDIAAMRSLPNMTVFAPVDAPEMTRVIEATLSWPHPAYIRFAKGGDPVVSSPESGFAIGRAIVMRKGADALMISTGVMTSRALIAAETLGASGVQASVLHVHTIKPLDVESICTAAAPSSLVVTIEEHSRIGGLGSAVADALADAGIVTPQLRLAFPDEFVNTYGSQDSVLQSVGLQPPQIAQRILRALSPRQGEVAIS